MIVFSVVYWCIYLFISLNMIRFTFAFSGWILQSKPVMLTWLKLQNSVMLLWDLLLMTVHDELHFRPLFQKWNVFKIWNPDDRNRGVKSSKWKWEFTKALAWAPYCSSWFWQLSPKRFYFKIVLSLGVYKFPQTQIYLSEFIYGGKV